MCKSNIKMQFHCMNRENLIQVMIGIMATLNIILLAISSYFSLKRLKDVEFGLSGAVIDKIYVSYEQLAEKCTLTDYCGYISYFRESGIILQIFLSLDIILLVLVLVMNFLLTILLTKTIKNKEPISRKKQLGLQALACGKNLFYLHPILVNLGFICWVINSKLNKLANEISLHEGLILLMIQSFLSWLSVAFNAWIISSIKRRNARMLRGATYNKVNLSISI